MIYLTSNTQSTVTVTLQENAISVNPYYAWNIVNIETNASIVFCADDYSPYPCNYNQFTFSVVSIASNGTATGSTNGTIYANAGVYNYAVFEMNTQYDLNLNNSVGIVEKGLLTITGTYTPYTVNTANDNMVIVVNQSLNYNDQ